MSTSLAELRPIVRIGDDPAVLNAVRASDTNLVLWRRRLPEALERGIARLDLSSVDDIELEASVEDFHAEVTRALASAGYSQDMTSILLATDIALLAERLASIARTSALQLRLEVVETDACRRFHADYVTFRLLTTYLGQGTQWLDAADAAALAAGTPLGSLTVQQLAAGEVAILKGRILADRDPAIHRSPPIADMGEQRLLCAINPLMEPPPLRRGKDGS